VRVLVSVVGMTYRISTASGVSDSRLMRADAGDVLEGGDLVPGFRLSLADLFE
jgi:hypothetical protein